MNASQNIYNIVRSGDVAAFQNAWYNLSDETERDQILQTQDQAGMSLLHIAAQHGHLEMVQELLGLEANIHSTNHLNQTPFDVAVAHGHEQIATLLQTRITWRENLQNVSTVPLNKTLKLIQGAYEAIEGGRNKNLVLALGETGVGKSTLINYLNGASYRKVGTPNFDEHTELVSGEEIARVGHSSVISETLYPQVFNIPHVNASLDIADLAGINGTRESAVELAGTLSTHMLARLASGIKAILFVIDVPTLLAGRGGNVRATVMTLNKILAGQIDQHTSPSVFFAITKVPQSVTVSMIIQRFITPIIAQISNLTEQNPESQMMLETLQMMQNAPERIFLPDVFDAGTSRNALLTALQDSPGLSRDNLNLLNVDRHQHNFNAMLTYLANEHNRRIRDVVSNLPQEQARLTEQSTALQTQLSEWNAQISEARNLQAQGMSDDERRRLIREKRAQAKRYDEEVLAHVGEHAGKASSIAIREGLLQEIDSDEAEICGEPVRFNHGMEMVINTKGRGSRDANIGAMVGSGAAGWAMGGPIGAAAAAVLSLFGGGKKGGTVQTMSPKPGNGETTLTNDKIPAPGNILDLDCRDLLNNNATFSAPTLNGNKFSIKLTYPLGQNVMAEVYAKVAKRDLPVNRARIERYRSEIQSSTQRLAELDANLLTFRQQREALDAEINELQNQGIDETRRIEQLNGQIRLREEWINQAIQQRERVQNNLNSLIKKCARLHLELEVNADMFATIYAIAKTLDLGANNPVIQEFMQEYEQFQQHNTAPQHSAPRIFDEPKVKIVTDQSGTIQFRRHNVAADGDCGYTAFGITRTNAYQLLSNNLSQVRSLLQPAVQEAILTEAFITYLITRDGATGGLLTAFSAYQQAAQQGQLSDEIQQRLFRYADDLAILQMYLEYDIQDRQIDNGWSHPCILQALAKIQGIELNIWQLDDNGVIPHTYYPHYHPTQARESMDLLFVNGNHFERLERVNPPTSQQTLPQNEGMPNAPQFNM